MIWVVVAVIVVLLVVIGLLAARQQRSRRLKEKFGPEYKRVVTERGDRRSAERELADRRRRMQRFEIRSLTPAARASCLERWRETQRLFVDEPAAAVREAHALVQQVMQERGYPVDDDFDQRAADISVEHPDVVDNYRAANSISARADKGEASTEQLRRSMVNFRALFDDLLAPRDGERTDRDGDGTDHSAEASPRETTGRQ